MRERSDHPTTSACFAAVILLLAGGLAPVSAQAHSYSLGEIAIGHIWAPPQEGGADGLAVYGAIVNRGSSPVRLVAVRTEVAEHARIRANAAAGMTWPTAITLRPDKPFALAPWREHVWLSGLRGDVQEGGSFKLELDFGKAGSVVVDVSVESATAH